MATMILQPVLFMPVKWGQKAERQLQYPVFNLMEPGRLKSSIQQKLKDVIE